MSELAKLKPSLASSPAYLWKRFQFYGQSFLISVFLTVTGTMGVQEQATAQANLPSCQPPQGNEYLLLVLSQDWQDHEQIQQSVPANFQTTRCQYLDDPVTRISGFWELDVARDWANYLQDTSGLSTFVVRSSSPTTPAPATPSAASHSGYNPQPLGDGYAVLVDYFNRPEVAFQLRQRLGGNIGLVSYGQRAYLLVRYTTNQNEANSLLEQLSDRGFWTMVVDSRLVTLLTPNVSY